MIPHVYVFLFGAVAVALLFVFVTNVTTRVKYRGLPGEAPTPILGSLGLLRKQNMYEVYRDLRKKYGTVFVLYLGRRAVVVISDIDTVKECCIKKFSHFHDRPDAYVSASPHRVKTVRSSMLLAKGSFWTGLRAAANPTFHTQSLIKYAPTINKAADQLIDAVGKEADSQASFCMNKVLGQLTMKAVLNCAFGVDIPAQESGEEHELTKAVNGFFSVAGTFSTWPLLALVMPRCCKTLVEQAGYYAGSGGVMEHYRDVLYSATHQLAESYCKANGLPEFPMDKKILGKGASMRILPEGAVPSDHSFMAAMMRARARGSTENVLLEPYKALQQCTTIITAGYETTALALTFSTFLIAKHPDAEAALLAEIDSVGRDVIPTYETLDQWPYAKACVREALRVYPVAPIISRDCNKATTLAGYQIHANTSVHIDIMSMHHNPEYFPSPEEFRPERFIDAAAAGMPDLHPAYMPFGMGPRNCIASRFALEEAYIVLIRLYQRFLFTIDETIHPEKTFKLKSGLTIAPVGGLWTRAVRR